jgi:DNA-binding LytR/AlgR family response regulator
MVKCVIIDDEVQAIAVIEEFLAEIPDVVLINTSTSPLEMITFLRHNPVDLIFLDVQMPKINGIDFIQLISSMPEKPQVILTTAYEEYAVKGYELNVVDYLLKPFSFHRFVQAVQKAISFIKPVTPVAEVDENDFFFVKADTKNKAIKVNLNDILYIEGAKNYVSIWFTIDDRIVTLMKMSTLESQLSAKKFLRVHRSYIIPTKRIKSIDGNRIFLMNSTGSIPLGETYRTKMSNFLNFNSFN